MDAKLPGIVVTGASGFVGRHFLASAVGRYRLFCLARRSRREVGIPEHENMRWSQVDVANWDTLRGVVSCIKEHGGASIVLHLAGYYDFHNMAHPEYERTNVLGTRNVLKMAGQIGIERFMFASSLAACRFPPTGSVIDEDSVCDADFAYAQSKHRGEEMIRECADQFPSVIVRMAAIFSDWCEYPPLYVFLRTWLSDGWNARILGGRGLSAVPYLHISDLVALFHRIIEQQGSLARVAVVNASPNHCTNHLQLFEAATRDYFGETIEPRLMPRALAAVGVQLRWWLGRLLGKPPFEAPWMMRYIDKQLNVNATRSHELLGWEPTPRFDVARRLLLMIENMKSRREIWTERNEAALRRVADRPNLRIAKVLDDLREDLVETIVQTVSDPSNTGRFCSSPNMDQEVLRGLVRLLYQVLVTAVRTRDRQLVRHYAQILAMRRRDEGFTVTQVQAFLTMVGDTITRSLRQDPDLVGQEQSIHDHVQLGFQLAVDGAEDAYDALGQGLPQALGGQYGGIELPSDAGDLERLVHQLEDVCGDG